MIVIFENEMSDTYVYDIEGSKQEIYDCENEAYSRKWRAESETFTDSDEIKEESWYKTFNRVLTEKNLPFREIGTKCMRIYC